MKTFLVTGGAGFIGSHVIEKLLTNPPKEDARTTIVCVDNLDDFYNPDFKKENIAPFKKSGRFFFYKADIRNVKTLAGIFKKHAPSAVVHLAAKVNTRNAVSDPRSYQSVNVDGTINLLELAKNKKTPFIFASSSSVYGNDAKPPFSESQNADHPLSPYGATKKAGELLAHTYHHNFKLPVTCLRIFNAYGERIRPELVMYRWAANLLCGKPLEISGNGKRERDYTYVGDIADGILLALRKPLGFEVVNLGNSKPISLNRLLKIMETATGMKARVVPRKSFEQSVERTCADSSKAKKLLKWESTVGIDEGVSRFIRWFKDERLAQCR